MSPSLEPWVILVWTAIAASFVILPVRSIRRAQQRGWFRFGWSPRYVIEERRPLFRSWIAVKLPFIILGILFVAVGSWGFLVSLGLLQ